MRDDELKDLLTQLGPAGLGPVPGIIGEQGEEIYSFTTSGVEIKLQKEKEDPIQAAIKKDPLFGSW